MKISNLPQATIITDDDLFVIVDNLSAFEKQTKQTTAETLSNYIIDQVPNEIFEYSNASSFPIEGSAGSLYVSLDTNVIYRWDDTDSEYVAISSLSETTDAVEQYANLASLPVTGQLNKIYVVESNNSIYRWDEDEYVTISSLSDTTDAVEQYANLASLPVTGQLNKIYVVKSNNLIYRWDEDEYVALGSDSPSQTIGNVSIIENTISTTTGELILHPQNGKISIQNNNIKKNVYLLMGTTTNNVQKSLTLDGNNPNQNNILIFNNNKTIWNYDIKISAYSVTTDEGCIFNIRGAAQKTISNTSILPENITEEWKSLSMENCLASVDIGNLSGTFYLRIGATGIDNMNIQWSAIAEISELVLGAIEPVFYSNEVQII